MVFNIETGFVRTYRKVYFINSGYIHLSLSIPIWAPF